MKLQRQAHVVYKTQYHVLWVTRYRRKILVKGIAEYFKKAIREVREVYPDRGLLKKSVQMLIMCVYTW